MIRVLHLHRPNSSGTIEPLSLMEPKESSTGGETPVVDPVPISQEYDLGLSIGANESAEFSTALRIGGNFTVTSDFAAVVVNPLQRLFDFTQKITSTLQVSAPILAIIRRPAPICTGRLAIAVFAELQAMMPMPVRILEQDSWEFTPKRRIYEVLIEENHEFQR